MILEVSDSASKWTVSKRGRVFSRTPSYVLNAPKRISADIKDNRYAKDLQQYAAASCFASHIYLLKRFLDILPQVLGAAVRPFREPVFSTFKIFLSLIYDFLAFHTNQLK